MTTSNSNWNKIVPACMSAWGLLLAIGMGVPALQAEEIPTLSKVTLRGSIEQDEDLSGAAIRGNQLVIGSDEGATVQVLLQVGENEYRTHSKITLLPAGSDEMDIEAIGLSGNQVYVAGSHAWVRKKVDHPDHDDRTRAANRARLRNITRESSRNRIVRFTLSADGERHSALETLNLRPLLATDPILSPFLSIPAKEGGLDLEGLAVEGETLYLGFRGPILRQNYVPVLKLSFASPRQYQLLFVNLEGYGIRDLLKTSEGMLMLAGPQGDRDGESLLYFWDGRDCVPGVDHSPALLKQLGTIPDSKKGNAEALALVEEDPLGWTVIVLYDSEENGAPRKLRIAKP